MFEKEEKKVEYVELIYDLIFVYIIGRSNSLIHDVTDGFITPGTYFLYIICTLVTIQIWNFTTLYINRYGKNSVLDHIALFVNMFLLYYMADAIQDGWQTLYYRYTIAWMLILVNLGVQYTIKYIKCQKEKPWELEDLRQHVMKFFVLAGVVAATLPVYAITRVPLTPVAMVVGIVLTSFTARRGGALVPVDFPHLTERVMLFIVFTFGEMVVAIAIFFRGDISVGKVYVAAMVFLIVVGLFVSYEYIYDHVIDRELHTNGIGYMTLNLFLIFALNNITMGLEFMKEDEVDLRMKTIFLVASFFIYFTFLALTNIYAKQNRRANVMIYLRLVCISGAFAIAMALTYRYPRISLLVSAIYIFAVLVMQISSRHDGGFYIPWIKKRED